ncbi:hypothetical protein GLOIN_2v1500739 [Rhizophagus irregularis DAOM 181602=DAOM 197198]|nr:hypothetical protein GLOIN_2v1500739 [Rhizophagus irregularis DAOM 181602=DAOM 197198]GET64871.1 hypothetical protein GLOIN_2v1500739 [Rhizophagus irregularis DAOM 181602=DAOM 197198]
MVYSVRQAYVCRFFRGVEDVAEYTTNELILFLQRWNPEQNLEFIQEDYDILRAEGIDGEAFLLLNLIEYREISLKFGPAKRLTMLAEEIMSDDIIS